MHIPWRDGNIILTDLPEILMPYSAYTGMQQYLIIHNKYGVAFSLPSRKKVIQGIIFREKKTIKIYKDLISIRKMILNNC